MTDKTHAANELHPPRRQYDKVETWVELPALERSVLDFWKDTDAFGALRDKNKDGEPWSFLDGPITANNPMGVHHAWGRSLKDAFQRYYAMNGRKLRHQNGFDCQGLWVEVEVEKELGFESKRDIRDFGIDTFVRKCKERVLTYAARQTEQSIRLGYWMDWDDPATLLELRDALAAGRDEIEVTAASGHVAKGSPEELIGQLGSPEFGGSYFTFSTNNNYTIWTFLKRCHEGGHLYRGTDVMPWCFRCGTGLSQMEITEGRKIVSHTSVFVRFPLHDREKEALLVWTTTPWTLTSNVGAAVNPEMTYLKVRHGDWIYYLGKGNFENKRIQQLEAGGERQTHKLQTLQSMLKGSGKLEILGELKGSELVGLRYDGPFDHLAAQNRRGGLTPYANEDPTQPTSVESHRVLAWDMVSEAEGTGIVHIAPGCGAEDSRLGRDEGLVAIAPLDESGRYLDGFGDLTGKHVLEVTDAIVADLKARGVLVAKESYPHVYPHCWRCKQELVFRLVDEWFIDMGWRERIQRLVPQIKWIPGDGEARELDWLRNMGDWMISKKRFWGLALPIWTCDDETCQWFDVIGDEAELRERATDGWKTFEGHTPHKPWVDAIKVECGTCGGTASRVEDVGNPWLDAGIVPYSTVHYNTDKDYWQRWFPANLVLECFPGQFRNWFYALLTMSAMMEDTPPFEALLGHALVRDEHGHEMHKSAGNAIWFDEAAEKMGADVMRWFYARHDPRTNLNFGYGPMSEMRGRFINTLWNTYAFFANYARLAKWYPGEPVPFDQLPDFDRWILSELQRTITACREAVERFEVQVAARAIEDFVEALSNWYVRHNRRRFWKTDADDGAHSDAAFATLHECLHGVMRLAAPMIPFMAEAMYQNIVRGKADGAPFSVHLTSYPEADESRVDDVLTDHMRAAMKMTSLALAARDTKKLKVRQPLAKLTIGPANDVEAGAAARFEAMLAEDLNVKAVEILAAGTPSPLEYDVKPNFKALGPRFGKRMKVIAGAIAKQSDDLLAALASGADSLVLDLDGETVELAPTDLIRQAKGGGDDLALAEDKGTWASVDTDITPELAREGLMRDALRALQRLRKEIGLEVEERIVIRWTTSAPDLFAALQEHRSLLMHELLADTVVHESPLPDHAQSVKVREHVLQVLVNVS